MPTCEELTKQLHEWETFTPSDNTGKFFQSVFLESIRGWIIKLQCHT